MKTQDVIAIDSYVVETQNTTPMQLSNELYRFLAKSYHLADHDEFERLILQPETDGEVTVLYGINKEIAGFSRTYRQGVDLSKKQVIVYSAYIYLSPHYKVRPTIESAGLTQAIKEKLENPQEEIIYLAFANNPLTYDFIYQLSDSIYPKPSQRVPEQILNLINAFKKQYGWIATNSHPLVINSPLVPLRSQSNFTIDETDVLHEFYLSTNPDYLQGNSLLVYMPLHLANINYGLDRLDSNCDYNQKLYHNPPQYCHSPVLKG
ncbi:hypothetical protein [Legionella quateirensis]|uniref:Uncharacterized protein n=1 Tax=Legionella quateirensis TaxID=45072 RepID=A0A378KWU3_9GAMM|nr:hypothetical protein [Legionella quateirensis]KTD49209.1 hypothetical protein Lqua_1661 [Legionella quateirensis]STY19304.1 Uncharacterised protein [Legionella quateirensis]